MSNIRGAAAHTMASCLQSSHAPMTYAARRPSCEKTFAAEQRLALMDGCAISLMYT